MLYRDVGDGGRAEVGINVTGTADWTSALGPLSPQNYSYLHFQDNTATETLAEGTATSQGNITCITGRIHHNTRQFLILWNYKYNLTG